MALSIHAFDTSNNDENEDIITVTLLCDSFLIIYLLFWTPLKNRNEPSVDHLIRTVGSPQCSIQFKYIDKNVCIIDSAVITSLWENKHWNHDFVLIIYSVLPVHYW